MSEGDWKPLSEYTRGDVAVVGTAVLIAVAVVAFLVLAFVGVIPGATVTGDPEPTPTAIASPTPEPTPEPVLLGGENRKACGLYWESYEWAVEKQDGREFPQYQNESRFWFTNDIRIGEDFITLLDGCYLNETGNSIRRDSHKDFDVEQFRVGENDLFHWGVLVEDRAGK